MKPILFFDTMLTPKLITALYWLMMLAAVIGGISSMVGGYGGFSITKFFIGVMVALFGVVGARIFCELLIVLFKMNEALQEIRGK